MPNDAFNRSHRPSDPIDMSLFSHIINDAFLKGSFELEGNVFARTIHYLNRYTLYLTERSLSVPQSLLDIQEKTKSLLENERRMQVINTAHDRDSAHNYLSLFSRELSEQLLDNNIPDANFYLPGGWSAPEGGHAMLYQFKMTGRGLYFHIYNTGGGLNAYHAPHSHTNRELHDPVLTYFIPNPINQVALADFFSQLIIPNLSILHTMDTPSFDAKHLYETIFPRVHFLNQRVSRTSDVDKSDLLFTGGQLSGTCSQRVLHQLLKEGFKDREAYQRFIYQFKRYALDDYMRQPYVNFGNRATKKMVKRALRTLGRIVTTDELFDAEFIEQERQGLRHYWERLPITDNALPDNPRPVHRDKPSTDIDFKNSSFIYKQLDKEPSSRPQESLILSRNLPLLTGGRDLLNQIEALKFQCVQLNVNKQYVDIIEGLEEVFAHLPLPASHAKFHQPIDFYSSITVENSCDFYQNINILQNHYRSACFEMVYGDSHFPRVFVTGFSIMAVLHYVQHQQHLKNPTFPPYFHNRIAYIASHLLKNNENNPYFATNNPLLDARIQAIKSLYNQVVYGQYNADIRFYNQVLNSFPDIKQRLTERYPAGELPKRDAELKSLGCVALYVLLDKKQALKQDSFYEPLLNTLATYESLERGLSGILGPVFLNTALVSLRLIWSAESNYMQFKSDLCNLKSAIDYGDTRRLNAIDDEGYEDYGKTKNQNKVLMASKYPAYGSQKACMRALARDAGSYDRNSSPVGDNAIQLFATKQNSHLSGNITTAHREFYHLRSAPSLQIKVTIDYFMAHLDRLSDKHLQVYVEANLFQPGLLIQILDASEDMGRMLGQITSFIDEGLRYYTPNEHCTPPALFFVRLAFLVYQYAAKHTPSQATTLLRPLQQKLNALIAQNDTNTPDIKHDLHQYYLSAIIAEFELTTETGQDRYRYFASLAFPSFMFIKATPQESNHVDRATVFEFACRDEIVGRLFQQPAALSITHVRRALDLLGWGVVEYCEQTSDFIYAVHIKNAEVVTQYTLDVRYCLLLNQAGFALMATPGNVKRILKAKQIDIILPDFCMTNRDVTTYLMNEIGLRIFNYTKLQKTWTINTREDWYQLSALSNEQAIYFRLAGKFTTSLPTTMKQRSTQVWVSVDKNILLTEHGHPTYRFDKPNKQLRQLDATGNDNGYSLCPGQTWFHNYFSTFESPDFIVVNKSSTDYQINFPRYSLTLIAKEPTQSMLGSLLGRANNQSYIFHIKNNPFYIMQGDTSKALCPQLPGLPGVAVLMFEHKASGQRMCNIPFQPFIAKLEQSPHSEFYHLQQDTAGYIQTWLLEQPNQEQIIKLWQYSDQERFITYSLDQNNQPVAETAYDALYLSYVYLASHRPKRAWKELHGIAKRFGGLQGQACEIQLLQMITQALPYVTDKTSKKASVSTPAYVACQLKALSLFVRAWSPDKKLVFPVPNFDDNTPDGFYKNHCLKQTEQFYKNLNQVIYQLYSRMQSMHRDITHGFYLTDEEKKELLDYYYFNLPGEAVKPVGALGYDWQRLKLSLLKKEALALDFDAATRDVLPEAYQKRQQDIHTYAKQNTVINAHHGELILQPLDLSIPPEARTAFKRKVDVSDDIKSPTNSDIAAAMAALRPNITPDTFIQHLPSYYYLVTLFFPFFSSDRTSVMQFCRSYLLAHRHVPLDEQKDTTAYLCNILYRIGSHPWQYFLDTDIRLQTFNKIIRNAENLQAPLIEADELRNKDNVVLAKNSDIWAALTPEAHAAEQPMTAETSDLRDNFTFEKLVERCALRDAKKSNINLFAKLYRKHAAVFGAAPKEGLDELSAGQEQHNAYRRMKNNAEHLLKDSSTRESISNIAKQFIHELDGLIETQLDSIIFLANSGFNASPEKFMRHALALDSATRAPLDKNKLLALYCKADKTQYRLATGLTSEAIDDLHNQLTNMLSLVTRQQALQRFQALTEKLPESPDAAALQPVAHELLSVDLVDYKTEAVSALFQYYENIALRPQQKIAINRLVASSDGYAFVETIEKIIMGGGKSKVILPLLAKHKARGTNLVVIEAPSALLETYRADLSPISEQLFDQKVYSFDFSRESDCSPKNLEFLHSKLLSVITQKDYLLTSGDAVQSLELRYLELLLETPDDGAPKILWEKQVAGLNKLVTLFRTRADVVMDEGHQALLLKKKLNYTLGDQRRLSPDISKASIALYQFFNHVLLEEALGSDFSGATLASVLSNNKKLTKNEQWDAAFHHLAYELVHSEHSPLYLSLTDLETDEREALVSYLLNTSTEIPDFVRRSSSNNRKTWALYKQQVSHLLPYTLRSNLDVNYGASLASPDYDFAIPYSASGVPNETSRFGNYLEAMNFSIQMHLIKGVTPDPTRRFLKSMVKQASLELIINPSLGNIDKTPTANVLHSLLPGINLCDMRLNDDAWFDQFFDDIRHHEPLICHVLETEILPHLPINTKMLHSDAYNHVDMYRSVQGITGTPWNSSTYHQRITCNKQNVAATDGFLLSSLHDKQTQLHACRYDVPFQQLIKTLLENDTSLHAIIDICAAFKGIPNVQVAQALASHFHAAGSPLEHIIFFNSDHVLCALKIHEENNPIIELNTSNPTLINAMLDNSPEQRFSYYDQAHAIGTDLKQPYYSKARVLVDHETHLQSFLQGAMRMRGLADEQTIEIIVPQNLSELSLDELITSMQTNETNQLLMDNFTAVKAKMDNCLRNDAMKRMLAASDVKKQQQYALAFQPFLVDQDDTDAHFFECYGGISTPLDTLNLLEAHKTKSLKAWTNSMQTLDIKIDLEEIKTLEQTFDALIEDALPQCHATYLYSTGLNEGIEVEVQNQVQVELEQELELELTSPNLTPNSYRPWFLSPGNQVYSYVTGYLSLSALCHQNNRSAPDFGEIYVGRNYYQTYQGQQAGLGAYLKPVHALLFRKNKHGKIDCLLLSQDEANELAIKMANKPEPNVWMSTTRHTLLAGLPPTDVDIQQDPSYQELIEKVRFFNGELTSLVKEKLALSWLRQDYDKKIAFFEENLGPYSEAASTDTLALKQALAEIESYFTCIKQHPEVDYTASIWWRIISEHLFDETSLQEKCTEYLQTHITIKHITEVMLLQPKSVIIDYLENNHFKTNAVMVKNILKTTDRKTSDVLISNLFAMPDIHPDVTQVLNDANQDYTFLLNCLAGIAMVAGGALLVIGILTLTYPLLIASAVVGVVGTAAVFYNYGIFSKDDASKDEPPSGGPENLGASAEP